MEALVNPGYQPSARARLIVFVAAALSVLIALATVVTTVLASDPVVTVSMTGNAFTPQNITVNTGDKIRWLNDSSNPHTVTDQAGGFHSGTIQVGNDYIRSFSSAGTVSYYCTFHPGMVGTITVLDGGAPPPATPTATPGGGGVATPASGSSVNIFDNGYTPPQLSVPAGTTIQWKNTGTRPHTVTSTGGSFTSGFINAGGTYSRTFANAGTFDYYCTIHPDMTATIVVTGGTAPPVATPTPTATPVPSSPTPKPTPAPGSKAVSIVDNYFSLASLSITTGTTVVWTNTGNAPHTATARDGTFDSSILFTGDGFSFTFTKAGTFEYYCVIHPEMVATVVVAGSSSPPSTGPTQTPTPKPSPTATPKPPPANATKVEIIDFGYQAQTVTIKAGTTVAWTNTGDAPHTVTENGGAFDSGFMGKNATWSRTFANPGRFSYYCVYHPNMTGTVVVTDAAGTAPTPGPTTAPLAPVAVPTVEGQVVRVIDNDYLPQSLTIDAGTEVTWVNQGIAPHTATDRDGLFDSGVLGRGATYTRTFDRGGTYEVFCVIHPDMVSHITVKGGAAKPTPRPAGSPTPTPTPPPPPAPGSAQMLDFDFAPKTLTVKAGATITWTNLGKAPHTVTANDDAFDSGLKLTGQAFTMTFKTPGTFGYYCTLHPQMTGTVVVTNAAGDAPPPAAGTGSGNAPAARVPSNPPPPAAPNDIRMLDNDFAPGAVTVRAGAIVRWVNAGQVPHTATASSGEFDSGFVNAGGTFSVRITTPGTYAYTCIIHPGMAGRLIVTDTLGQAPPPAAPVPGARPNDTGSDAEDADAAATTFEMVDFDYQPRDFTARPGEEILWINTGEAPHTVTARDGSFDSGIVMAGGEFKLAVDKPGVYEYYCALHPQMVGTLTVSDSAEGGNGAPGSGTGDAEPDEDPDGGAVPNAVADDDEDSGAVTALVLLVLLGIGAGGLVAVALPLLAANRTATRR